jgi:hypothetical protein
MTVLWMPEWIVGILGNDKNFADFVIISNFHHPPELFCGRTILAASLSVIQSTAQSGWHITKQETRQSLGALSTMDSGNCKTIRRPSTTFFVGLVLLILCFSNFFFEVCMLVGYCMLLLTNYPWSFQSTYWSFLWRMLRFVVLFSCLSFMKGRWSFDICKECIWIETENSSE